MTIIKKLVSLMAAFRSLVVLSIALGWATTISWIALISTSAYLISYAALQPSIAELQVAIVGVRFFGLSRGIFRYLERLISHTVTFKLLSNLRVWFYEKVEPLAPAGLEDFEGGDLLSRVIGDVEVLQEFYVRVFGPSVVAVLSSLSVFWFFGRWSLEIAITIIAFHFVVGVILPYFTLRTSKNLANKIIKSRSRISAVAVDQIQGSAEILALGQENAFLNRAERLILDTSESEARLNRIRSIGSGISSTTINLIAFVLLLLAIPYVTAGLLDGKILAVIILGSLSSFEAVVPLPQAFQGLELSLQAGKRLFGIVDRRVKVGQEDKIKLFTNSPSIIVKNLAFSYSQENILQDVSFTLPFGKKIAIVGMSGSGKTTISNLLMRFWEFSSGEILINGEDYRRYENDVLRKMIAYVPQDNFIFNGTVAENIRIGKPSSTMAEVIQAAQKANIHEFILTLPKGYQTYVGEMGAFLSGGQRQKLSIARAAIRDVPIYLLDEPFSNLDQSTEKSVHISIMRMVHGKSLILITHRIANLTGMDEIIVLQNGFIIERGTEEELISMDGQYKKMLKLQNDLIIDPNTGV